MKTKCEPIAFRPTGEVREIISILDGIKQINRSELYNRAMMLGLPQAIEELRGQVSRMPTMRKAS